MARLNPRRRAVRAKQAVAISGQVAANRMGYDLPRSAKAEAKALRTGDAWSRANATAQPPQGAVFTAKVVRPWLNKRFKRFARS